MFDVSIILPCYNEGPYLEKTIEKIVKAMSACSFSYEIIIAEDASTDNTKEVIAALRNKYNNIVWLHRDEKIGRGSAVAHAIFNSRSNITGFIDADLETPAHYILPLIVEIKNGADIASAIRIFKLTLRDIVFFPKTISTHAYKMIARFFLKTNLIDTEVGCKFFKKEKILPILTQIKDKHWFWDTEVMVRPYYEGYKIVEVPTLFVRDWKHVSKQHLIKDSIEHLRQLWRFRKDIKQLYGFKIRKYEKIN